MVFSIISFLAGIIVVQQFSELPEIIWIVGFLFLIPCLTFLRYWRLMFFVVGLLWAIYFASIRIADRLPEQLQGQHLPVTGKVVGLPQYDERRVRFDLAISKPKNHFPKKIRVSWFVPEQEILPGQTWELTVKLKKPHGRFNPGTFDYERWLFIQNIGAVGYVRNKPEPRLIGEDLLWQNFSTLRQHIANNLNALVGEADFIGIIKALTLGERSDISQKQWEVFRKTGTIHLLAISGLHIGLISGLVYFLVLQISIRLKVISPQIIAAISAISIAIFYSALAGFSLPTQRALLMLSMVMLTRIWQRNILPGNTLALTLFAILLVDPLAVLSVGFWLSFLAVALIIYSLAGRLGKIGFWQGGLKIHWITALGLAPLLLFYFQQVSIISPLANFITVPVISLLIVPLCLLAVILMFVSLDLARPVFELVDNILHILWEVLIEMSELPFAVLTIPSPPFYIIALALAGVFVLLLPRGMPGRYLGWVLLFPLVFVEVDKPEIGDVTMTLLDVGQGLSTVIETAQHVLVFDTGAKYSNHYDMGNAVVLPFLSSKGIDNIDLLLISHGDNDHVGGAYSILEQINVEQILTSVPEIFTNHDPTGCKTGQSWIWDQVRFEILSPIHGLFTEENDNSCVLKVSFNQGSILLTGDIEQSAEDWLVNNMEHQLKNTILIAPHHGSKTSSSLAFLKQVDADIILIPAGYKNRFSFPHKMVLERYKNINTPWLNVADEGAIIVEAEKDLLVVKSARKEQGKYWNK